jgi:hypothetical protein
MLRTAPKAPKCKHCKKVIDVPHHVLHDRCVQPWIDRRLAKQQAQINKQRKLDWAIEKRRKAALQTIPELIKLTQRDFNAYIRERDKDKPCICCGRELSAGDMGGAFDCGHYRSTGSASHLRFDERNAHAQNKQCNRWGAGRAVDYRIGLVGRLGIDAVESLEASNKPHKWTADELRSIRATYKAKLKELK